MQTFVAVLMWLLVASLLILRRGRAERSITYAAITIAVAMTINVDAVYQPIDALLGGSNVATLIGDCALMVGIFFLGRGIMKAGEYQPGPVRIALGPAALLVALSGVVVAFLLIDRGATTTNFMIDLGAQPAAAAYSMIQFTYYGIVVGTMAVLASRQYRLSVGVQRLPAGSLVVGAILGVVFCVVVLIMDVAHLVGRVDVMSAVSIAYAPLYLLTFAVPLRRTRRPADRALPARSPEGNAHTQPGQRTLARMASGNDRPAGTEPVGCRTRAYRGSRGAVASASRRDPRRDDRPASVVLSERERSTRSRECRAASPWRRRSSTSMQSVAHADPARVAARSGVRAPIALAGAMAAVASSALGLGLVIARRLTAPPSSRRFDLAIRGVEQDGDRQAIVLDRTDQTESPGVFTLLFPGGGWLQLSAEVLDRGPGRVARIVTGAAPRFHTVDRRCARHGVGSTS